MKEKQAVSRFHHRLHVDRMEGRAGYVPENMCLACQRCNITKNGYLTHEQMKEVAAKYFKEQQ